MPKRLIARKLSNSGSSIQTTPSSETTLTWAAVDHNQMMHGRTDQVKLYNPNDFLQAEGSQELQNQSWTPPNTNSWSPNYTAMASSQSSFQAPTVHPVQDNWANGSLNGPQDPWAWNTSNSPSPEEVPILQGTVKQNSTNVSQQASTSVSWNLPQENLTDTSSTAHPYPNYELSHAQQATQNYYQNDQELLNMQTSSQVWDSNVYSTAFHQPVSGAPISWQNDASHYNMPYQNFHQTEQNRHVLPQPIVTDDKVLDAFEERSTNVIDSSLVSNNDSIESSAIDTSAGFCQQQNIGLDQNTSNFSNNEKILEGAAGLESTNEQLEILKTNHELPPKSALLNPTTSHLFQRSDSWLSGSSLQTIQNSLCGSQDTLDASHYMPPESIEAVRQYMASLAISQEIQEDYQVEEQLESTTSNLESNTVNQEIPLTSENSDNSSTSQSIIEQDNLLQNQPGSQIKQVSENFEQDALLHSESNVVGDDGVRQPPDGAAAIRPINTVGAIVSNASTGSLIIGNSPALPVSSSLSVDQTQLDNTRKDLAVNRTPEESENVENLQALPGIENLPTKPEPFNQVNFFSKIGPRDGSPFKPPPKTAANISSIIQQELPENETLNQNLAEISDNGANLEMTPDNIEHPVDLEHSLDPAHSSSKGSSPSNQDLASHSFNRRNVRELCNDSPSATLWQNPEPIQGNVFLVPAASSSSSHQNILIVPQLSDQQDVLDNPLGRNDNSIPEICASDNIESVAYQKTESAANSSCNEVSPNNFITEQKSSNNMILAMKSNVIQQEFPASSESMVQRSLSNSGGESNLQLGENTIKANVQWKPNSGQLPIGKQNIKDGTNGSPYELHLPHNRGQRPPVPGLGPVQPPRAMSEPPDSQLPLNTTKGIERRREPRQNYGENDTQIVDYEDVQRNESHSRNYEGHHYANKHGDPKHPIRGYDDPVRHENEERLRGHMRERRDHDDRRHRDDYHPMNRDRSRPSSRGSVDYDYDRSYYGERSRDYPYHNDSRDYDSDRESYYRKRSYDYREDPYKRDARQYRGYDYSQAEQDRYYSYYNNPYYGYNNYNYGYYDELYRTDPHYQAQYEARCREYYAHYGYDNTDRRSVQSGRSSVNDELQQERDKFIQSTPNQSYEHLATHSDYSQQQQNEYLQRTYYNTEPVPVEKPTPARLTPVKFQIPHAKVHFTATGHLLKVLPNSPAEGQPAVVEVHDLQSLFYENLELEELKKFPGPLQRRQTHKNDVIQFCSEKARLARENISLQDRESNALIWDFLSLLVRQNGTLDGTDIAELLLKENHYLSESMNDNLNIETSMLDGVGSGDVAIQNSVETVSIVKKDSSVINKIDEEKITKKFREYLLFGHKKEALESAMKHGLWGHALFLASKMDARTYAMVMTRFANSLKLNDPLQTLYQLMSGRQPAAVTCIAEEKWGDWRPHLAMILSNPTNHPDTDRKSIVTLGDTLATRGCLQAAQFCYLMAQMEFGTYSSKTNKLVLLGANHSLPFNEFATTEAIQCTEVYEYAQSLANQEFLLPHFQSYRFIYATRLAEFGLVQEALHYCEVISSHICRIPAFFHPSMIGHVFELANKLKYFDPHYTTVEGEKSEIEDPLWLQHIQNIIQSFNMGMISLENTLHYSDGNVMRNSVNFTQNSDSLTDTYQYESDAQINNETIQSVDQFTPEYQYTPNQQNFSYSNVEGIENLQSDQGIAQHSSNIAPHQQVLHQSEMANQFSSYYSDSDVNNYINSQDGNDPNHGHQIVSENQTQTQDFWDMSTNKTSVPPSIKSTNESMNANASLNRKASIGSNRSEGDKSIEKKQAKAKQPGNSGWGIGGLISKFLPKPKNQMKLPDDHNPTIVWDAKLNRWINTDDDDEDVVAGPVAPPTDTEILKTVPASRQESAPSLISQDFNKFRRPVVKAGRHNYVDVVSKGMTTTVSNALPSTLFPLTDVPANGPQLLIPTAVPESDNINSGELQFSSSGERTQIVNQTSKSSSPLIENEADKNELSRSSSQSSLAREVQQYMAPSIGDSQYSSVPAPAPMMFNPTQMHPTTFQSPGSQKRLGQYGRRYPQ